MKKFLLILTASILFLFSGCLETEQGISINDDGSGRMELKTDMSQLMAMASMAGIGKVEKIKRDTIIRYKNFVDTGISLTRTEKELISKASWHIRLDFKEGIFDLTLLADFRDLNEIDQLLDILDRWNNVDVLGEATKDLDSAVAHMDNSERGNGKNIINDFTKNYFKTNLRKGKLTKSLDTVAYKKINEDENLNSFKKLGELAPGVDKILEEINVTSKFVLPKPAKKAEGKNVKLSEDKKTVTMTCPVSDIYTDPKNFEYKIEY